MSAEYYTDFDFFARNTEPTHLFNLVLGTALIKDGPIGTTEHDVQLTVSGYAGRLMVTLARQEGTELDFIVDLEGATCEISHGTIRIVGFQSTPDMLFKRLRIAFAPQNALKPMEDSK